MQYQNITTLQKTNPKTSKWLFLMPVTLKLTNLLCLTHTARRTRHVPPLFPNYLTRSLCAAPRDELGITKWRRNFEAFRASALRTSLPVNLSSSPVWKSKTAQQLFPSFPTWEQQKNSTAALLLKNGLSQGSACRGCTAFQPPERSFLCHQCPHLDNLTQMISGQF